MFKVMGRESISDNEIKKLKYLLALEQITQMSMKENTLLFFLHNQYFKHIAY